MRITNSILLAAIICFTNTLHAQIQCDNDSTGLVSLVDLKTGTYMGYQGGLYPAGSNKLPPAHKTAGLQLSKQIKPLDTAGNVDLINGRIVLASFGASTAGEPFNHFVDLVHASPSVNPCLQAVNACYGGKGVDVMEDPVSYDWYWPYIYAKLAAKDVTPEQVQVAWFKSGSKGDDPLAAMGIYVNAVADRFEVCLQLLHQYFPNLKMVFLSGFIYGGYGDPTKEFYDIVAEPGSYYNNWTIKWLIQRQIDGTDPGMVFQGPSQVVPYCAWGPHEWADGLRANAYDGLTWDCETEFSPDGGGYHLTNVGRDKEGQLIWDFFAGNVLTKRWFNDGPKWSNCIGAGRYADGSIIAPASPTATADIKLYPNPGSGQFIVTLPQAHIGYVNVSVVNAIGQMIYQKEVTTYNTTNNWVIDITDKPAGIYYVSVNVDGAITTKTFELVK